MKISIELRHLKKTYLCKDGSAKVQVWVQCAGNKCNAWSWYDDISFCPFCGAKLEYVKKLGASQ
jgi:hypothetical protein